MIFERNNFWSWKKNSLRTTVLHFLKRKEILIKCEDFLSKSCDQGVADQEQSLNPLPSCIIRLVFRMNSDSIGRHFSDHSQKNSHYVTNSYFCKKCRLGVCMYIYTFLIFAYIFKLKKQLLKTRKQQVKYVDEIVILLKGSFQLFLIVKEIIFYKVPEVSINKVLNFISVLPLVKRAIQLPIL